ncbi:MAG: hypothetical protein V1921_04630 [Candidatus Altiarchaeota archaeon]
MPEQKIRRQRPAEDQTSDAVRGADTRSGILEGRKLLASQDFLGALDHFRGMSESVDSMSEQERYRYSNLYARSLFETAKSVKGDERARLLEEAWNLGASLANREGASQDVTHSKAQGLHILSVVSSKGGNFSDAIGYAKSAYDLSGGNERLHGVASGQLAYALTRDIVKEKGTLGEDEIKNISDLHHEATSNFKSNALLWHNHSVFEYQFGKKDKSLDYSSKAVDELNRKGDEGGIFYTDDERAVLGGWAKQLGVKTKVLEVERTGQTDRRAVSESVPIMEVPPELHKKASEEKPGRGRLAGKLGVAAAATIIAATVAGGMTGKTSAEPPAPEQKTVEAAKPAVTIADRIKEIQARINLKAADAVGKAYEQEAMPGIIEDIAKKQLFKKKQGEALTEGEKKVVDEAIKAVKDEQKSPEEMTPQKMTEARETAYGAELQKTVDDAEKLIDSNDAVKVRIGVSNLMDAMKGFEQKGYYHKAINIANIVGAKAPQLSHQIDAVEKPRLVKKMASAAEEMAVDPEEWNAWLKKQTKWQTETLQMERQVVEEREKLEQARRQGQINEGEHSKRMEQLALDRQKAQTDLLRQETSLTQEWDSMRGS